MGRISGYVDGCLRRHITSMWMHTGILSGRSVVANSVLRRNFVMSSRMAENLTSSVKMPFLRLQFLLSTKKRYPYYCYIHRKWNYSFYHDEALLKIRVCSCNIRIKVEWMNVILLERWLKSTTAWFKGYCFNCLTVLKGYQFQRWQLNLTKVCKLGEPRGNPRYGLCGVRDKFWVAPFSDDLVKNAVAL